MSSPRRENWTTVKLFAIAVGFFIIVYFHITVLNFSSELDFSIWHRADVDLVRLTLLSSAKNKGALCLDGSLPGYHFLKGTGAGSLNWIVHVEGGGWCKTVKSCIKRKSTALGSSNHMQKNVQFDGILSNSDLHNPDFFAWNKVKIRYCDGGSFSGHADVVFKNGEKVFFKGKLIWDVIVDELLLLGMHTAQNVLLSGCSAGGLATLIHCDDFKERLPNGVNVKCLTDAAFFIDEKDVSGSYTMRSFYQDLNTLQNLTRNLPQSCVSEYNPRKLVAQCMFPREIIKNLKTPLFVVQPAYDFWQIQNILVPEPLSKWRNCRLNLKYCHSEQFGTLLGYRDSLLREMSGFMKKKDIGYFINSCYIHCQTWEGSTWHSPTSPRINNKTIAESVGDWFFNRGAAKFIDCSDFSCNPSCSNKDFIH